MRLELHVPMSCSSDGADITCELPGAERRGATLLERRDTLSEFSLSLFGSKCCSKLRWIRPRRTL